MSKAALLADFRIILRHLRKLPSDGSNCFKASTIAKFRENMDVTNQADARDLRWKAHDAAQMLTGLRVRKDLLDLHAGEKMTQEERIKLTALRVGLNTPAVFDEEREHDGNNGARASRGDAPQGDP